MLHRSSLPAPARLFTPGCALAAGLLILAPCAQAVPAAPASLQPAMTLRVGKTATYPLAPQTTFTIEAGALNIFSQVKGNTLSIKALGAGEVRLRLNTPGQPPRVIALQLVEPTAATPKTAAPTAAKSLTVAAPIAAAPIAAKPPVEAQIVGEIAPDSAPQNAVLSSSASSSGFGSQMLSPALSSALGDDSAVETRVASQVVDRATAPGDLPLRAPLAPVPSTAPSTGSVPAAGAATAPVAGSGTNAQTPFQLFPPGFGAPTTASPTSEFPANPIPPQNLPPQNLPSNQSAPVVELTPQGGVNAPQVAPGTTNNAVGAGAGNQLGTPLPAAPPRNVTPQLAPDTRAPMASPMASPMGAPISNTSNTPGGASVSSILPVPAMMNPKVTYQTTPKLPPGYNQISAKNSVEVTQGLARLLTFQNNILSVFFSDPSAMDARAINARTIAVTGTGPGQSTLAVFTARYPGDAVGYASVYRITTLARGDGGAPTVQRDPATVEEAITAALGDPRIRVSVVKLPDDSLAARLTGVVRNDAEVQGALTTASFFAPRVLPSVYADVNAPSIDAVLSGAAQQTPQAMLEDNLRRITGNPFIELISMPGSLILKAEVESQEAAQQLMQLLPSLNQAVVPFITIRGGGVVETSNIPLLQGEDLQLTQKLQAVTGVRTVYAARASGNSMAIYGTARTRGEYEAVKRYGLVIAQSSLPIAPQGTTQGGSVFRPQGGEPPPIAAYDPAAGYARQLGVQMFVRILDPNDAVIRNVTIETNIVEITRTNLKNLGAEYGSATLLTETKTPGTPGTRTPLLNSDGNPTFDANGNQLFNTTPGTPGTTTRTGLTSFNSGLALLGNGLLGSGGFGAIDPFRVRINAVAQNNNARVLASPNIRATEGTVAQITIGGERPVPTASASFGANAQSIEFRRFGVILTMRPTVSDDNTIILQIRADVTQPDPTFAINVGGAIIPGESVRSIDTTITVRPGDIVVMGGLLTNDKRQQTSKVPILGDIPILGALFRSKRFENNETELAIFMTPRIDALPATINTLEIGGRIPSFPALPGRQESNSALFQAAPRTSG